MIRTLGNRTKKIYLGHLSKENNIKEVAHMTMENQLARADLAVGHDFEVLDTSPDTATPDEDIGWKTTCGWFLYAYLRKSISSNEFALYPKFVYDRVSLSQE